MAVLALFLRYDSDGPTGFLLKYHLERIDRGTREVRLHLKKDGVAAFSFIHLIEGL